MELWVKSIDNKYEAVIKNWEILIKLKNFCGIPFLLKKKKHALIMFSIIRKNDRFIYMKLSTEVTFIR